MQFVPKQPCLKNTNEIFKLPLTWKSASLTLYIQAKMCNIDNKNEHYSLNFKSLKISQKSKWIIYAFT